MCPSVPDSKNNNKIRIMVIDDQAVVRQGFVALINTVADMEVIAEGTEQALTALERVVRRGPAMARVEGVEKLDLPHDVRIPNRFEVR